MLATGADARRVAVPVAGRGSQALDYVAWLNLPRDNLNRDDPITADLSQVAMASAGILQQLEGAATDFEPLIQTSAEAEQIPLIAKGQWACPMSPSCWRISARTGDATRLPCM